MKKYLSLSGLLLGAALTLSAQTPTAQQMKTDLIGHTMGGRQSSWKFQSTDQIKQLTIKNETNNAHQCIFTIALLLQATNAPARYAADARVEYTHTASGWKLNQVGLLSLKKLKSE
jgi:hypothetical protein